MRSAGSEPWTSETMMPLRMMQHRERGGAGQMAEPGVAQLQALQNLACDRLAVGRHGAALQRYVDHRLTPGLHPALPSGLTHIREGHSNDPQAA